MKFLKENTLLACIDIRRTDVIYMLVECCFYICKSVGSDGSICRHKKEWQRVPAFGESRLDIGIVVKRKSISFVKGNSPFGKIGFGQFNFQTNLTG